MGLLELLLVCVALATVLSIGALVAHQRRRLLRSGEPADDKGLPRAEARIRERDPDKPANPAG